MRVHINVNHRDQRDFKCDHAECGRAFGYKHLLQRHMAKIHGVHAEGHDSSEESEAHNQGRSSRRKKKASKLAATVDAPFIEALTGKAYKRRGEEPNPSSVSSKSLSGAKVSRKVIRCPWPHFSPRNGEAAAMERDYHLQHQCEAIFHRAYDLRRHLKADHALVVEKAELAAWLAGGP
jgi:general transcription factor IIIA